MSQVNGKYLKDENGDIFSPIVGIGSIVGGEVTSYSSRYASSCRRVL